MAKPKKSGKRGSKSSVKVSDLSPQKNPKGGRAKFNEFTIPKVVDKSTP